MVDSLQYTNASAVEPEKLIEASIETRIVEPILAKLGPKKPKSPRKINLPHSKQGQGTLIPDVFKTI